MPNRALVLVAAAVLEARNRPSTYSSRRPGRYVPTIVDQVVSFTIATDDVTVSRDETLIKALVRAHRWRRRIESGQAKSITDLAEQEGVTDAYICRLLPLTCLAPGIVEAILDGRQSKGLRLAEMLGNGPMGWEKQRLNWGFGTLATATQAEGP
jgi:hypothetical protein